MIATHLGVIDEDQINNMTYIFFQDVLKELGYKLNYDAMVNYAGNSFVKDSWDMINDVNPMNISEGSIGRKASREMANFFSTARVATKEEIEKFKAARDAGRKKGNEKA